MNPKPGLLVVLAVSCVLAVDGGDALAQRGGRGGGGGFRGGGGMGGFRGGGMGGFRGAPSMGGFRGGGMGGFRGAPNVGGFRGAPNMSGFRGAPNMGGFRGTPNMGGLRGAPGMSGFRGAPNMGGLRGAPGMGGGARVPGLGAGAGTPIGGRLQRAPGMAGARSMPGLGAPRAGLGASGRGLTPGSMPGRVGRGPGASPGMGRGIGPGQGIGGGTRTFGRSQPQYGMANRPGSPATGARNPIGGGGGARLPWGAGGAGRGGIAAGNRGPGAGGIGGGVGGARPPWGAGGAGRGGISAGNRSPIAGGIGGGSRFSPASFNGNRNPGVRGGFQGRQGLGWRNPYLANHQGWIRGNWGGMGGAGRINNINNNFFVGRGGSGWGNRGWGWGGGGWGMPGWGWGGWWPGFGLGMGLGWGLGGLGWGWGGLGWGLPWGWGMGWGGMGWGLGGMGLGWGGLGLSSWLYGPALYNWGYLTYANPYLVVPQTVIAQQPSTIVAQPSGVFDYSQPIDPTATQPATADTDEEMVLFEKARAAFKNGDYSGSLDLVDQAIRLVPNDPALHEFRGLALFALKRYDEAATPLYAVLSLGPGWDWPTLIDLYPDVDVYTRQLRDLEAKVRRNPDSTPSRFVLAYHYLAQGHVEAAIGQLTEITRAQPRDQVSAQVLQQLRKAKQGAPTEPSAPAGATTGANSAPPTSTPAAPALTAPRVEGRLEGSWTASPADGTTITLTFVGSGKFSWKVDHQGKVQEFQGDETHGGGMLTLAQSGQDAQPPLVGRITWVDLDHFTFKLIGGPPDDSGLKFSRPR